MFRILDWLVAHLIGATFVWWLVRPTTASAAAASVGAACACAWGWFALRRSLRRSRAKRHRAEEPPFAESGTAPPPHPSDTDR